MSEQLVNQRIDQLEEGFPTSSDYSVYRDTAAGKTKKFKTAPSSITSGNFEWTSANAVAGNYDINSVVTKGGTWWQSQINNNPNVPGTDATWVQIPKSSSGFVRWQAGAYVEDEVFVWEIVIDAAYLFRLKNVARPYVSADFEDELAASDWELMGKIQVVQVNTALVSDIITLDFNSLQQLDFFGSAAINEPKEWVFSNPVDGLKSSTRFNMGGLHIQQLPLNLKLANPYNAVWDGALKQWTPLEAGEYELEIVSYHNNQFNIQIHGPFN